MKTKVIKVDSNGIRFENGYTLTSYHGQDCCESHELYFQDLALNEFDRLEFDLSDDKFFNRIEGYGIELVPISGHSVRIAGHGSNNGYYSTELTLVLIDDKGNEKRFDVSECQDIQD